jgi:L-iditol 2-dehydrogenase
LIDVLRLHATGDLRLHAEVEPVPQEGELLIRVTAVGLCGSDRHWVCEGGIGDAKLARPLVLGHEFAGIVAAGPREGQRVVLEPAIACGHCETCRGGLSHLCPHTEFAGHSVDGALRTLLTWPEHLAYGIPDSIADRDAPLFEPLGVALHALDLGHVGTGTRAGVFGCGPLGLLLIQAIRAAGGAVVCASDRLEHRVAAAAAADVGNAVHAGTVDESAALDVAFEVSGDDAALAEAIAATRPGGRIVLVGIPDSDRTSFAAAAVRRKGLTLLACRRMKATDLPRAIDLVADGAVELSALVTSAYPLREWSGAFDDLVERRGLKVIVQP